MEPSRVSFRIQAKNFSITCPQSKFTKEIILDHFKTFNPQYLLVAQENHQDGGIHFHALLMFDTKKNIKTSTHFDFQDEHFNIQATRNIKAWMKYIEKDGDFVESGVRPNTLTLTPRTPKRPLSQVDSNELRDYCVDHQVGFGYYKEEKAKRSKVDLTIHEDPKVGIMNMFLQALQVPTNKTIVLLGPTGCGKTTWAKKHALKPTLMVSHIESLKQFNKEIHKSIIFDDMSFTHWGRESQIHIVDEFDNREIHGRYSNVILPAGLQKIFTCNVYPFVTDEAIERRIKLINC